MPSGEAAGRDGAAPPAAVRLTGRLVCRDAAQAAVVRCHLPEHVRLTLAEPGCLSFHVAQTGDPLVWSVEECFADRSAFAAHQARTRSSPWWEATADIPREYAISGTDEEA